MKTLSTLAVSSLLLTAPLVSASDEDFTVSGNVTLATDYTFRGVSQTDEKFAIQGGFDVEHSSGAYLGIWASNVDFDSVDDSATSDDDGGATAEVDFYGGYVFDLAEGVSLDLGYIFYMYPGDESALNYQEFVVGLNISDLALQVIYSDEYFGDDGPDAYILNADYSISLAESTSLDLHVGYSDADEADFFEDGEDSYVDYSIGVSTEVRGVTLGLTFVGTDLDNDLGDERVVFSISKAL